MADLTKFLSLGGLNYYDSKIKAFIAEKVAGHLLFEIVETLDSVTAPKDNVIYLVPNAGNPNNVKDEYMWINGAWELIGTTAVDLTPYYKKTEADTLFETIANVDAVRGRVSTLESKVSALEAIDHDAYKAADTALEERITTAYEAADSALETAYKAADTALEERITTAYKAADSALETAYKAADTALEERITTAYEAADSALGAEITTAYIAADSALETKITGAYEAADTALEERITTAYEAADNTLGAEITAAYEAADKAVKTWATGEFSKLGHKHEIADVNGLQDALDAKADADSVYTKEDVDGKIDVINKSANTLESRVATAEGNITALQTGKADKATTLEGYGITNAVTTDEHATLSGIVDTKASISALEELEGTVNGMYTNAQIDEKVAGEVATINAEIAKKANAADVYTKGDVDGKVATINADIAKKANAADVYTKSEVYTKEEVDAMVITNAEIDALFTATV